MINFHCQHSWRKSLLFRCKLINNGVLQIDMCLRIQNLKKIGNWFTNKGTRAISVRDVFNKNIVVQTFDKNFYFSDAIYSIKHNSKVLILGVGNRFRNEGAQAISVRSVFNSFPTKKYIYVLGLSLSSPKHVLLRHRRERLKNDVRPFTHDSHNMRERSSQ